jgi:alpha-beta hydrolase superfamily lysophospholipase
MGEILGEEFFVETDTGMKLMVAARIPQTERLGQAVLLVHGSGVGWPYWDIPIRDYSVMGYLSGRGFDVYALECRGYGKSTKPNGLEVTAATMAVDIKSVATTILERSGVDRVSMVGHSSGGTALLIAGGKYPELIARMVIIGTPYKKINPMFLDYAHKVVDMAGEPGKDYVPNLHYQDLESRLDDHDEDVLTWYKKLVEDQYSLMPGGLYPDLINNPGIEFVPKITVPTLILNGSNEYVVDPDDTLAMFKDLGVEDKCMVTQPGGYHLMFVEKRGHIGLQETLFYWLRKN